MALPPANYREISYRMENSIGREGIGVILRRRPQDVASIAHLQYLEVENDRWQQTRSLGD